MKLRAVIYPRVSSENQRDKGTIKNQHVDLPAVVRRQGWTLVKPVDYYSDDGKSAKAGQLDKRGGFVRLVEDMKRKPRPFDVVVMADLDRLTRSDDIQERGEILGPFQRSGVLICNGVTGQVLDLKTSTGDLLAVLGTWHAAEDNRKRSERTRSGQRTAVREGRKPNGRTPFGLHWDNNARGPAPLDKPHPGWSKDPVRAAIVSACFRRVGKGESLTEIARDLHRRGRPTSTVSDEARAKRLKNHGSLPRWTPSRVYAIVRNARLYADGEWRAPGFEGVIRVPPLVTAKEAAAADLALASHGRRNKKRQKQQYLCQGILRCDLCRANVAATYAKPQSKTYLFYVCARRRRRPIDAPACTLPILRAEEVDARVWAKLTEVLENPAYLEGTIREQQMSAEDRVIYANDLAEAEARLREYDRRCGTLLEQYKAGRLPEPVWQQHLTSMNRERAARVRQVEAARAGIDLATQRAGEVENIMEIAQRLQRRLRSASFETRRELVQALIPGTGKHVITVDAKGRLTMNVVFAAESDHLPVFGEARKSDTRRGDPAAQT